MTPAQVKAAVDRVKARKAAKKLPPGVPTVKAELAPTDVHAPAALVPKRKALFVRAQLGPGGSLHVRHQLADGSEEGAVWLNSYAIHQGEKVSPASVGVRLNGPAKYSSGEDVMLVWVQLAEAGAWKGHASGPFALSAQTFAEIKANFDKRAIPVMFDLNHVSESDPTEGTLPPEERAKAWAWAHRLDNRGDDGLWGLVEWLEKTNLMIGRGELKYISPAIRLQSKDQVTGQPQGARLSSCAVTNNPFLSHMPGLIAASDAVTHSHSHEFMPHIRACLRCASMATPHECSDALDKLRDYHKLGDGKACMGVDVPSMMSDMRDRLRVPLTTSDEDLFEQVQEMIDSAIAEHEEREHGHGMDGAPKLDDSGDEDEDEGAEMTMELAEALKKIGELEHKLTLSDTALEGARTQVTTLTDKVAAGDKAIGELAAIRLTQRTADVEEAIVDHGLKQSKDLLLSLYDKAPSDFLAMFPKKSPKDKAALRNLTAAGGHGPPDTVLRREAVTHTDADLDPETGLFVLAGDDPLELTDAVMKKIPHLPFGEAQIKAQRLLTQAERRSQNERA